MSKKIIVCQHVPYEPLGTLNPLLKAAGFRIRYVNFGRDPDAKPSLDGYDGLVILGGPMSAADETGYAHIKTELHLIEEALKLNLPLLGICLGSQLMARALGAQVMPADRREIGWYVVKRETNSRVFRHFDENEHVFQWHGDTFELPKSATLLISGDSQGGCRNQAFSIGEKAFGIQFHLECDEGLIERWLTIPEHQEELAHVKDLRPPDRIRAETKERIDRLKTLSDLTFGEFINLFGEIRKDKKTLPSR